MIKSLTQIIAEAVTSGHNFDPSKAGEYDRLETMLAEIVADPENPKHATIMDALDTMRNPHTHETEKLQLFTSALATIVSTLVGSSWNEFPLVSMDLRELLQTNKGATPEDREANFPNLMQWVSKLRGDAGLIGTSLPNFSINSASSNASAYASVVLEKANARWKASYAKLAAVNNLAPSVLERLRPDDNTLLDNITKSIARLRLMQIGMLAGGQDLDNSSRKVYRRDHKRVMQAMLDGVRTASDEMPDVLNNKDDKFLRAIKQAAGIKTSADLDVESEADALARDEADAVSDAESVFSVDPAIRHGRDMNAVTPGAGVGAQLEEAVITDTKPVSEYDRVNKITHQAGLTGGDMNSELSVVSGESVNNLAMSGQIDQIAAEELVDLYGRVIKDVEDFDGDGVPDSAKGLIRLSEVDYELFKGSFINPVRSVKAGRTFDVDSYDVQDASGGSMAAYHQDPDVSTQPEAAAIAAEESKRSADAMLETDDIKSIFRSLASNQAMAIAVGKYLATLRTDPALALSSGIKFMGTEYRPGTPIMKLVEDIAEWRITDDDLEDDKLQVGRISDNAGAFLDISTITLLSELLTSCSSDEQMTQALARYFQYETDRDVRGILTPSDMNDVRVRRQDASKDMKVGLDEYGQALTQVIRIINDPELFAAVEEDLRSGNNLNATVKILHYVYPNYSALSTPQKAALNRAATIATAQPTDVQSVAQFLASDRKRNMQEATVEFVKNLGMLSAKIPELPKITTPLEVVDKLITVGRHEFNRWLSNIVTTCQQNELVQNNATLRKAASLIGKYAAMVQPILTESVVSGPTVDTGDENTIVRSFFGTNRKALGLAAGIIRKPIQELETRLIVFAQYVACRFALLPNALRKGVRSSSVVPGVITTVINPIVEDFNTLLRSEAFNASTFQEFRGRVIRAVRDNNIPELKRLSNSMFNKLGVTPAALTHARTNKVKLHHIKPVTAEYDVDF